MCTKARRVVFLALGSVWLALAVPALAAPVLFSGNITTDRAYTTSFPGLVLTASGSGTASATGVGPASFTIPAFALTGSALTSHSFENGVWFELPGAPVVTVFSANLSRYNVGKGGFAPSLSPGATYILFPNTTAFPNSPPALRTGFMRLKVGPNGLGGNMLVKSKGTYTGFTEGYVGRYSFVHYLSGLRGSGTLVGPAPTNPGAITGMSTNTSHSVIMLTITAASTRAPWITGTVTAINYDGVHSTFTHVATGVDARNTAGTTGTISLVTPQTLNTYWEIGTILQRHRVQYASTSKLTLNFSPAPEPGRMTLLASGLLGPFWLARLGRGGIRRHA